MVETGEGRTPHVVGELSVMRRHLTFHRSVTSTIFTLHGWVRVFQEDHAKKGQAGTAKPIVGRKAPFS